MEYLPIRKLDGQYFVVFDILDAAGNVILQRGAKMVPSFLRRLQEHQVTHLWVTHQDDYQLTPHSFPDQAHVRMRHFSQIFQHVGVLRQLFKDYFIHHRKADKYYFHQVCDQIRERLTHFLAVLQEILQQTDFGERLPGYFLPSSPQNYQIIQRINGACLAAFLASKLALPQDLFCHFVISQFFIDIGILPIPDKILEARRQLEPDELALLQKHPLIGSMALQEFADILEPLPSLIALQHHESQDGSGYPQQLKGNNQFNRENVISQPIARDKLHPLSEIASLIDVFSALISFRPFRRPLTIQTALSLIRNLMVGSKINTELFHFFERSIDHFPVGCKVIALNGTYAGFEGIVIKQNKTQIHPIVLLTKNQDKERVDPIEVDCAKWQVDLKQIF